jgi:hypothetical protein
VFGNGIGTSYANEKRQAFEKRRSKLASASAWLRVPSGRRSVSGYDTNLIMITSPEWRAWLRLEGGGCKMIHGTATQILGEQVRGRNLLTVTAKRTNVHWRVGHSS